MAAHARWRMRENYREKFRVLGLKIAYYRKLRGMTQEQFAEAIGRSVSFETKKTAPNYRGVVLSVEPVGPEYTSMSCLCRAG